MKRRKDGVLVRDAVLCWVGQDFYPAGPDGDFVGTFACEGDAVDAVLLHDCWHGDNWIVLHDLESGTWRRGHLRWGQNGTPNRVDWEEEAHTMRRRGVRLECVKRADGSYRAAVLAMEFPALNGWDGEETLDWVTAENAAEFREALVLLCARAGLPTPTGWLETGK